MSEPCFDRFPAWIVAITNVVAFAIYILGAVIMHQFGMIALIVYLAYLAALELRLIALHCVHCYYYGKRCAFGRGQICALLFKRGSPEKFSRRQMTWKDMIPDMLVAVVPAGLGIFSLIRHFEPLLLAAVVLLILLSTMGNKFVRSSLACAHCRQRQLGCPALSLFEKPPTAK